MVKPKILIIHNRYAVPGRGSGEEVMVDAISSLLKAHGHEVLLCIKNSLDIEKKFFGKTRALFSGIYNFKEEKRVEALLEKEKPDVVFVQNVFPLFSPSVLTACKKIGIPVVMRCPNYRLLCPTGLFLRNGRVCELCAGGNTLHCVIHNCESNMFKSIGYAVRHFVARQFSLFKNNVDVFMPLTEFAKDKLIDNGFDKNIIQVISGLADTEKFEVENISEPGSYVGFAGRVSHEKGVDTLVKVAKRLPDVMFKIAGKYDGFEEMVEDSPDNVVFLGQLGTDDLKRFYSELRILLMPSKCYEGLPVVMIEAMLSGKPVITSDLGGLPEVVTDKVTGLICRHDDIDDFTEKIELLWNDPYKCMEYGLAGKKKAVSEYSPDAFYGRLLKAIKTACQI